jgi:hypothetical protein
MFLIITKYLIPRGFRGITTFPFFHQISCGQRKPCFINHEKNTLAPAIRIISTSLFIWYILNYLVQFVQYKTEIWLIEY